MSQILVATDSYDEIPLSNKAGYYMWQELKRAGVERDNFRAHNTLTAKPILLDPNEKPSAIVTLGANALSQILGIERKDPIFSEDYLCYPIWSEKYSTWVIPGERPEEIQKGRHHMMPVLQFAFKRALEIAKNGLTLDISAYLLDPTADTFQRWVDEYFNWLRVNLDTTLSYDIETNYKQGESEDSLGKDEENEDFRILRISFAYRPNEAVSIPWTAEYWPQIERILASNGTKLGWNSANYDDPRILQFFPINGDRLDGMLMWHVLNSALPKSLGFVTPFYVPTTSLWKHLSSDQPAFYNAKDADMALRCYLGIKNDLIKNKQWDIFMRHVVELNRALTYMSGKGVILDQVARKEAETKVQTLLDGTQLSIDAAIPQEVFKLKAYKKTPKDTSGLILTDGILQEKVCVKCGEVKPKKPHDALCGGEVVKRDYKTKLWALKQEFKLSKQSLTRYQEVVGHIPIYDHKEKTTTFNEKAMLKLIKTYKEDKLYPRIIEYRGLQKLLSTYIGICDSSGRINGGMPCGADGRIHTIYTHNPSTLRLASQNPNLQNLPRPNSKDPNALANLIRNFIIAAEGHTFAARDYSGIEAVLVGYFAASPGYIRLAKMDVHSFYTAYALHELDGRVSANDLPLLSWDDDKLRKRLSEIKKEFSYDRNTLYKHLIHGGNYKQGAKGAAEKIFLETGVEYAVSLVQKVMHIYFELFPEIPKWHTATLLQAERDGYLRNPFNYVHRFNKVFDWEKIGGKWQRKHGPDTNKVIAFLPQSTAAGIIKEAILRLFFDRFEEAGQFLRLQIHDEIFSEVPDSLVQIVDAIKKEEMEKPILSMPLPASYNMGPYLTIDTEPKFGKRWGSMK